jgi:hypothetical protein
MRAFRYLDSRVVAAHQWVVDATGRWPRWWAEQCAWGFSAVVLARFLLAESPMHAMKIAVLVVCSLQAVLMVLAARSDALIAVLGEGGAFLRWCNLFFFVAGVVARAVLGGFRSEDIVNLGFLFTAMYMSFASCRPPRLRHRRSSARVRLSGGAA